MNAKRKSFKNNDKEIMATPIKMEKAYPHPFHQSYKSSIVASSSLLIVMMPDKVKT